MRLPAELSRLAHAPPPIAPVPLATIAHSSNRDLVYLFNSLSYGGDSKTPQKAGQTSSTKTRSTQSARPRNSCCARRPHTPPERRYIDRDESWLLFNRRVLEEADDPTNPLLERVKFLAITSQQSR